MSDDLCQCPNCGREHHSMGFGKPPQAVRQNAGVPVLGIRLRKESQHTVVDAEIGGVWVEVIRELSTNEFCHIVEPSGIWARYYQPGERHE